MFNSISWQTYFLVLATAGALYYVLLAVLFFRAECSALARKLLSGKMKDTDRHTSAYRADTDLLTGKADEIEGILKATGTNATEDELLEKLDASLAGFEGLRHGPYMDALAFLTSAKTRDICGLSLDEEQLKRRWERLAR